MVFDSCDVYVCVCVWWGLCTNPEYTSRNVHVVYRFTLLNATSLAPHPGPQLFYFWILKYHPCTDDIVPCNFCLSLILLLQLLHPPPTFTRRPPLDRTVGPHTWYHKYAATPPGGLEGQSHNPATSASAGAAGSSATTGITTRWWGNLDNPFVLCYFYCI